MSGQTAIRNGLRGVIAFTACAGSLAAVAASAAPRIEGPASMECRDTLAVADAAFRSTAFQLTEAVTLPPNAPVRIVAQRKAGDISGGDAVVAGSAVFKAVPQEGNSDFHQLYWQVTPDGGSRWVITDRRAGWRGDIYDLYAVDLSETPDGFAPLVNKADPRQVMAESWLPPLMLRDAHGGAVWAVDTSGFDIPGAWHVYSVGADGVKARCTIVFGPEVKTAFDLLPAPVRALAVDLDGTMGSGRDEGTLEPTGTLRDTVSQAWADTVLRPWAVTTKPYNRRRDVDAALRHWSRGSPDFRALYQRIEAEYPAALDALSDLYVRRFGKTPEAARALATRNLDIVYRSHFVFPQYFIHPKPKPAA